MTCVQWAVNKNWLMETHTDLIQYTLPEFLLLADFLGLDCGIFINFFGALAGVFGVLGISGSSSEIDQFIV